MLITRTIVYKYTVGKKNKHIEKLFNVIKIICIIFVLYKITFNAEQLVAGMYIYSLIVNNNLVDSKRMVITK